MQRSCPLKEAFSQSFGEVHHLSSPPDLFNFRKRRELFLRVTYFEEENELVSALRSGESTCASQMGAACCPDRCAGKTLEFEKIVTSRASSEALQSVG